MLELYGEDKLKLEIKELKEEIIKLEKLIKDMDEHIDNVHNEIYKRECEK